ncbi:hypothetical protein BJV82DRAFT_542193 [Fennellomyces sp. T-0311]|nr:hypothetical protein BJV82DRAFT_542193 [Fennellomyces sp. T-0311]
MAATQEPKIDFNFYEQPSTISYFDAIVDSLRSDLESEGADTTFTAPELAHFTARFQQFQQDALGPSAAEQARKTGTRFPLRIPASFFRVDTLTQSSPLYAILKAAYSFQSDKDISDWQFDAPEEKDIYLELAQHILQSLEQSHLYKRPVVAFDPSVDSSRKTELGTMVESLGGSVTSNHGAATHVVSKGDHVQNDPQAVRILDRKDGRVLVHWLRRPDSHDSWIEESEQQQYRDATKETEGAAQQLQIHVNSRWVTDSYKYNEWMNAVDYIQQSPNAKSGIKRTMEESSSYVDESNPMKKSRTPQPNEERPGEGDGADGADTNGVNNDPVVIQQRQRDAARKYISIQTHEIIIPSYAAWFDLSVINDIERRSLPEFFNNRNRSKTPAVYKDYRDFMVNTYRLNPVEYLTVTACRRNMTGDVCAIIRVHAFLEQWGLINYQVDPDAKPSNIGPPFSGQFKVVADMPKGLITNNHLATPAKDAPMEEIVKEEDAKATVKLDPNLELRRNIFDTPSEPTPARECVSCSKTCGDTRYRNGDSYLCNDCYKENKLPANTTTDDFTEECAPVRKEPWTEQEDLLLLEGLRMYEEDWNAVAEHIGTRSRDECILHYLHLPIEDPYVDSEISKLGLLQFDKSRPSENPIMSVVAFLASTVKPEVAAAAGQQREPETDKKEDTDKAQDEKDDEARMLSYKLIRSKLQHFEKKVSQYEKLEAFVEEERRKLERERHQLNIDRLSLQDKVTQVRREVAKRGNTASANSITPAQIQQQIAGGVMSGAPGQPMYMNAGQPNPMQLQQQQQHQQQQQQQFQMQMQRQMQAQQQGHQFQQQPPGHNYNMMSF